MKPEVPDTLPDHWLEFWRFAMSEADRESDGQPQTILINQEGTEIQ